MSFDEDGRPGAEGADGAAAGWEHGAHLVIPDDIRELDADVRAYHREQRSARRHRLLRRLFAGGRFGATLPVLLAGLFLAALYSVMMLVVASPRPSAPHHTPLASPRTAPGHRGGLLPDVRLTSADGSFHGARELRPAVLLLTPRQCDCDTAIRSAAAAAEHGRLQLTVAGTDRPDRPGGISDSLITMRAEPTGRLLTSYHVERDPVVLLVGGDGVVTRVFDTVPSAQTLNSAVETLTRSAH